MPAAKRSGPHFFAGVSAGVLIYVQTCPGKHASKCMQALVRHALRSLAIPVAKSEGCVQRTEGQTTKKKASKGGNDG